MLMLGDGHDDDPDLKPGNNDLPSTPDLIGCAVTDEEQNSGSVTVLLAISKCLNDSSIAMINDWVDQLRQQRLSYFQGKNQVNLDFATSVVSGGCEARSERQTHGEKSEDARADEYDGLFPKVALSADDRQRFSAFEHHGLMSSGVPESATEVPIAVISFVSDQTSFQAVEQYERKFQISNVFNFQICENGQNCQGAFQNCVFLKENVDLFMYNPFTVVRSFYCNALTDGIPVSYISDKGTRECFCKCPLGSTIVMPTFDEGKDAVPHCEKNPPPDDQCNWEAHGPFRFGIMSALTECKFGRLFSQWHVVAPFAGDNYVADQRVNEFDDDLEGRLGEPRVEIVSRNEQLPVNRWSASSAGAQVPFAEPSYGTKNTQRATWRAYDKDRGAMLDQAISTNAVGKFRVDVVATDYSREARCKGCFIFEDGYRPRATTQCPTADDRLSVLSLANLGKVQTLVNQFYDFQTQAINDACSKTQRCDDEKFSFKNFLDAAAKDDTGGYDTRGRQCFSASTVQVDFAKLLNPVLKSDPFKDVPTLQAEIPIGPSDIQARCSRCCSYSTALKEKWTDFQDCGSSGSETERCDGLKSETCAISQCVSITADALAKVDVCLKPAISIESRRVLGFQVGPPTNVDTSVQIHRSLDCSKIGADESKEGTCSFQTTVNALFDRSTTVNTDSLGAWLNTGSTYVFWRYKTDVDNVWRRIDDNYMHTFKKQTTIIAVEAWTQCGRLLRNSYTLILHPQVDINVCSKFPLMWTQQSNNGATMSSDVCTVAQSDFAEFAFEFSPTKLGMTTGLDQNSLQTSVSKVMCRATYTGRSPLTLLSVDNPLPLPSSSVARRYAVRMISGQTTTAVTVACDFTFSKCSGTQSVVTCNQLFNIKPCTAYNGASNPYATCPNDCASSSLPAPYQACGGSVVQATATGATLETKDKACCQACASKKVVTSCRPLLNVQDDIKRCIPTSTIVLESSLEHQKNTGVVTEVGAQMVMLEAQRTTASLLVSLALVLSTVGLAIGLVAVRKRGSRSAPITEGAGEDEGAHYALLD